MSTRRTVSGATAAAWLSATIRSAQSRNVHRFFPAGGGEHARAIRYASCAPSRVRVSIRVVGLGSRAAWSPASTNRGRTRTTVRAQAFSVEATSWSVRAGALATSSAWRRIRACARLRASALPVPIIASNSMRSSDVRVTRYLWAIETSLPVAKTTKFPAGSVNQPDKARVTDH